jgi:hypothetical protein
MSVEFGQSPIIAPVFMPSVLEHIKEHMVLWYINSNYELMMEATESDEEGMRKIMEEQDPATRKELSKTLAAASGTVMERSAEVFKSMPEIIQQTMQALQQFQPPPPQMPLDPNAQAETERKTQDDAQTQEFKRIELQQDGQIEFAKLSAEEREQAVEAAMLEAELAQKRAARLEELMLTERAEDERIATKLASDERRNTQDNLTALQITAAELEAGNKSNLSTGTGINP